jgi:hypothetical protein
MNAGHPIGLESTQVLPAFSGKDTGPTHHNLRDIFVREARKYRRLARQSGLGGGYTLAIGSEYARLAKAAAKFAAQHHAIGRMEAVFAKASESTLPADERRGVFQGVNK